MSSGDGKTIVLPVHPFITSCHSQMVSGWKSTIYLDPTVLNFKHHVLWSYYSDNDSYLAFPHRIMDIFLGECIIAFDMKVRKRPTIILLDIHHFGCFKRSHHDYDCQKKGQETFCHILPCCYNNNNAKRPIGKRKPSGEFLKNTSDWGHVGLWDALVINMTIKHGLGLSCICLHWFILSGNKWTGIIKIRWGVRSTSYGRFSDIVHDRETNSCVGVLLSNW